ncbi:cobalt ABC transporter ATP-binding protein [Pontibacillus halophilus JSM 076056 = DSM 19796]|uniref:Cobalt ABC transporter ATP-binding protein n=1 Tax=Pontibacillus halophilus JSM 076056 = DSM 19796 TaxID=1385510 RepID=A0A0A5GGW7_9BACI|nr:energy-coupling factor ABC transporter ATP-binding protein [Pontibacillus halophilus]KGX90360.1 cobalt ABC transporter ATP-binding protein [Pontibacillus halophilus JSM 076056 = DSM 19796]
MKQSYLKLDHVSFRYREEQPNVLKNVNIEIYPNEWVAIIGHNGSGKSTIAKLMNGLLYPTEGNVVVDGLSISDETVWEIRKRVGMVFQNPDNQFVGTTVKDDVAFGLENQGVPRDEMVKRIHESLSAVDMLEYEEHEPHRLSGGQKQRVAIASVLAVQPDVILLDEATAMLDPKGRRSIMHTVQEVREQREASIVTITHDLNEVAMADRVIVMNKGQVWFEGTPRDVFQKQDGLREIGLDIPFVAKLTQHLTEQGVEVERQPLDHEELIQQLWK